MVSSPEESASRAWRRMAVPEARASRCPARRSYTRGRPAPRRCARPRPRPPAALQELAAHDEPTAYPGADRQVDQVLDTPARPVGELPQGRNIGVVAQDGRDPDPLLDDARQGDVLPVRQRPGAPDDPGLGVQGTGSANTPPAARLALDLVRQRDDALQHGLAPL